MENDQLILHDYETIQQMSTFVGKPDKKGLLTIYEAEIGNHDDCISPLVLLGWLTLQSGFENYVGISMRKLLMDGGAQVDLEMPTAGYFDQSSIMPPDTSRGYELLEDPGATQDFWNDGGDYAPGR